MRKAFQPKEKIPEQPHVPPMPSIAQPKKCKYLLPCSICDRTGEPCWKYGDGHEVTKIYPKVGEDFGSWEVK